MRSITLLLASALLCAAAVPGRAALTEGQLTPQEHQKYNALKSDETAAANFLITRDYVRKAKAVVAGSLAAASMPDEPDGFDPKYLFPGEINTLNKAVQLAFAAYLDKRNTA